MGAVGTEASVTVTVFPATVSVPALGGVVVAAAVYATVPEPLPLLPLVMEIQEALVVAVQVQPLVVVTAMVPLPPVAGIVWVVGETVKVHAAPSFTVTVWPATVNVPVRGEDDEFAATV